MKQSSRKDKFQNEHTIRTTLNVAVLATALLASGAAFAYEATAFEKTELAQLNPQLRGQVEARMTGGQTARGILETMLLNNISALFATNRIVAVDFEKGVVVVDGTNGQMRSFTFDVTTLVIKS
jgi:hypothetical protein